uniref:Fibrinolytic protease 1 n=1 Tax=Eisenia fetida TaxID=6396 RepID=Q1ZZB7_EISFE|nr:fibrinolytic protease 1 [Eisenia fetida]
MGGEQYIIGGSNASPGEFPWQLSQTRGGSHSCGASLLNALNGLSASHCVDGAAPGTITVIAGLHDRSGTPGSQEVDITGYTMHENYNQGTNTYANDIAILHFASAINIGGNVQAALLPANNNNDYSDLTCVISGWGRTGSSNVLPDTLQKASIQVIGTTQCQSLMGSIGNIWDNHICLYDNANNVGSCNGDSGGPLNCPDGGTRVAGVTSWGVSSGAGNCLQTYPSVYTRTSAYLSWIANNS